MGVVSLRMRLTVALAFLAFGAWGNDASAQSAATTSVTQGQHEQVTIAWKVVDRYRLFLAPPAPKATAVLQEAEGPADQMLDALASVDLTSDRAREYAGVYDVIYRFLGTAASFDGRRAALPYHETHWIPSRLGRGAPTYDPDYLYPAAYHVALIASGLAAPASKTCRWTVRGGASGEQLVAPCDKSVDLPLKAADTHDGSVAVQVSLSVSAPEGSFDAPPTPVQVKDRLILSLGDSYAAGEGDPDTPANFSRLDDHIGLNWPKDFANRWWVDRKYLSYVLPADWTDAQCHRSLYTQHFVATALYAARHPHEAVSYVSFACSGAMVVEGVIGKQFDRPGIPEAGQPQWYSPQIQDVQYVRCAYRPDLAHNTINTSALAQADGLTPLQVATLRSMKSALPTTCQNGFVPRKVDAVMLSIGGNDVNFAGVVMSGIVDFHPTKPVGDATLLVLKAAVQVVAPKGTRDDVETKLGANYKALADVLKATFGDAVVVQSAYPAPVYDERGEICGSEDPKERRSAVFDALTGLFPDDGVPLEDRWTVAIQRQESANAMTEIADPLNAKVRANVQYRWAINDAFQPMFLTHGWCARAAAAPTGPNADMTAFPNRAGDGQPWLPQPPADWAPYARAQRWFRTSNDAILTQLASTDTTLGGSALDSVVDRINLRWALRYAQAKQVRALAGTFHPTFSGHVAMGASGAQVLDEQLTPDR